MTREEKLIKVKNNCVEYDCCDDCILEPEVAVCMHKRFDDCTDEELDGMLAAIKKGHEPDNLKSEEKEMTVEEIVRVLDKNSRFVIRICHTDKALYNPLKDEEKWEIFRRKEVVQFTPVGDGIIIYVAPPTEK